MRRRGVSRPPFWAPKIFKANRQTQQIRHRQMCWKLACTPPQRRRRRNPGRTMTLVAKPPLSMGQCPATQRNLQLSWKSGEEEIKFRRLMRLRKNVWTGETNARPPSVAATAALHYLQADDEPFNQASTQQIKTGLPKAAGNVKNIAATEWLARQRQHHPSCTAQHFAFDIDLFKFNMAERNQFQASAPAISKPKTASYLKPFLASRYTFHFQ